MLPQVMTAITLATYSPKSELENYIRRNIARAAKNSTLSSSTASSEQSNVSTLSTTQVCTSASRSMNYHPMSLSPQLLCVSRMGMLILRWIPRKWLNLSTTRWQLYSRRSELGRILKRWLALTVKLEFLCSPNFCVFVAFGWLQNWTSRYCCSIDGCKLLVSQ